MYADFMESNHSYTTGTERRQCGPEKGYLCVGLDWVVYPLPPQMPTFLATCPCRAIQSSSAIERLLGISIGAENVHKVFIFFPRVYSDVILYYCNHLIGALD
jgi:hypothetical protein